MPQPNIVWIYCDELRADALGCYGNSQFQPRTPYLDLLARMGSRFDACYCNSPVCVPSRTSVLTGLYPERTGVYHNEACWTDWQSPTSPMTLPQYLVEEAGYTTANFGKVHTPQDMDIWQHSNLEGGGMREYYGLATEEELAYFRPPGITPVIGGRFPGDRPYPAEKVAENALAFMAQAQAPYMARLSILQPHTPVFPRPPYDQLYDDVPFFDKVEVPETLPYFEKRFAEVIGSQQMPGWQVRRAQVAYYGLVSWIDEQVGRVITFLRDRGELGNTIIVFDADHGCSLGEAGRYQKQTFARASHRVPRIIAWPGHIEAGIERNDVCESLDLARTLCSLIDIAPHQQFLGRDLYGDPEPEGVYASIGYGFASSRCYANLGAGDYPDGHGWPRRSCIRTQRYRLDKSTRQDGRMLGPDEADLCLIDRQSDPEENINRAADPAYADVVAHLNGLLDAHLVEHIEVPEALVRHKNAPS